MKQFFCEVLSLCDRHTHHHHHHRAAPEINADAVYLACALVWGIVLIGWWKVRK